MTDFDDIFGSVISVKVADATVGDALTDEEIRKRNQKYVDEVVIMAGPPKTVTPDEMLLMRERAGTEKANDPYPATMAGPALTDDMKERVNEDGTLNFNQGYNPDDFFIKETGTEQFIKDVQLKIRTIYDAPHRIVNGKKVYDRYYYNVEAWCLELFFEAINWDVKIVETVMQEQNKSLQNEIAGIGFATLAYWARGKK